MREIPPLPSSRALAHAVLNILAGHVQSGCHSKQQARQQHDPKGEGENIGIKLQLMQAENIGGRQGANCANPPPAQQQTGATAQQAE